MALVAWASPIHAASSQTQSLPEAIQITIPSNENNSPQIKKSIPDAPYGKRLVSSDLHGRMDSRRDSTYSGKTYSKEEVQALIVQYSNEYGSSPEIALRISYCESGWNQFSANKSSSARGVFQWLSSSWKNQPASFNGTVSVFDADANVKAAVWLIAHGQTSPWNASRSCWSK